MFTRNSGPWLSLMASTGVLMLSACQSGPPTSAGNAAFTVAVKATPPSKWTYTITPTPPARFSRVEIVAAVAHSNCKGQQPSSNWLLDRGEDALYPESTAWIDQIGGQRQAEQFSIECEDAKEGPAYVIVEGVDAKGNKIKSVFGPLAGPS